MSSELVMSSSMIIIVTIKPTSSKVFNSPVISPTIEAELTSSEVEAIRASTHEMQQTSNEISTTIAIEPSSNNIFHNLLMFSTTIEAASSSGIFSSSPMISSMVNRASTSQILS